MAFNYQGFATLGVNLNRQKYGPLDISNVFTSEADLKYYLSKGTFIEGVSTYWIDPKRDGDGNLIYKDGELQVNSVTVPYPYEGQVLATVIDGVVSVYALSLDAEGNFQTQEIGAKIETDDKTIRLVDGKLELVGLPTEVSGKTFVPSLVNGVLTWAEPDTSTSEGQQQAIDGLDARVTAIEQANTSFQEEYNSYKGEVSQAIAGEKARAEEAERLLGERIDAIDFVDETELENAIKDFATKDYVDGEIDKVEELIGNLNHFKTEIVDDVSKVTDVGILYLIKDESVAGSDKYNEYILVGEEAVLIGDTTTDLSNYYNKGEIDGKVEALESAISDESGARELLDGRVAALEEVDVATKSDLESAVGGIETSLLDYAKNSDVESLAGNVYTKEEIDGKIGTPGKPAVTDEEGNEVTPAVQGTGIFANAYSREEIDKLLDEVQGGSSASADSVLRQLNTYKSTNDERVKGVEDKNATQDTAIETAQAQADKGVADAAKVAADLVTANLAIAENTREIGVVKSSIETVNTNLSNKISALEGKDTEFDSAIAGLNTVVEGHTGSIATINATIVELTNKDVELAAAIQANTDKFGNYTTTEQLNALLGAKADASAVYTKGEVDNLLANLDQSEIKADIKANADAIAVLVGEDTDKSIRTIAAEEINALIDAANNEDTITNINSLINYVNENAGEIAQLTASVADNTGKLAGIESTVVAYVDSKVAAVKTPKSSDEIDVSLNGTISINQVNVNKLVQSDDEEFIIDGGHA